MNWVGEILLAERSVSNGNLPSAFIIFRLGRDNLKYILPFDMSPGCITYHNRAFPLGIIKANLKQYNLWLASKLINSIYRKDSKSFDLLGTDIWGNEQGLFDIQSISVIPEIVSAGYIDIINLLQFALRSGHYITGMYNEYYIPRKNAYETFNFVHDYLLIGFDDSKKKFFSVGYIDTQRYEMFEIDYLDYFQSICKIGTNRINLSLRKINQYFDVEFNLEVIIQQLENYINSVPSSDAVVSNDIYGIKAWFQLADYVCDAANPFIDVRYTRLFMEHKEMMLSRLLVLQNKGLLSNKYVEIYSQEIMKPAKITYYLCLKYNLTHDFDIADRAYKMIKEINDSEYVLLNKILRNIKLQSGA